MIYSAVVLVSLLVLTSFSYKKIGIYKKLRFDSYKKLSSFVHSGVRGDIETHSSLSELYYSHKNRQLTWVIVALFSSIGFALSVAWFLKNVFEFLF